MGWFSKSDDKQELTDEQAVERYRYMLRTAPPDAIEQAHEEAFARLTPEQRRLALQQLTPAATPEERRLAADDPKSLARLATRTEIRQPGALERLFGSGGSGFGGMLAGSLLASVAGSFIGSAIANSFFDDHPYQAEDGGTYDDAASTDDSPDDDGDFDGGDFGDIA